MLKLDALAWKGIWLLKMLYGDAPVKLAMPYRLFVWVLVREDSIESVGFRVSGLSHKTSHDIMRGIVRPSKMIANLKRVSFRNPGIMPFVVDIISLLQV